MNQDGAEEQSGGIGLEDIYFTLFRHKWMILGFLCAGVLAALLVPIVHPAPFVSWSKLMVPYVVETKSAAITGGSGATVTPTQLGGQGAIIAEGEILKSADVATKAAQVVGPAKILAKRGGGDDLAVAAGVVLAGIDVDNPRGTDILIVSFKHPDQVVAQDTLKAIVQAYRDHHLEVHMGGSEMDQYYTRQIDDWRAKLADTDQKLRKAKSEAGVVNIEDTMKAYQDAILKWQEDLRVAQGDLAERMAIHHTQSTGASVTNDSSTMPPSDKDNF